MSLSSTAPPPRPPLPRVPPRNTQNGTQTNAPSKLFSPTENDIIFATLGKGRRTLVTVKATLLTPTVDLRRWQEMETGGAVCFVRDEIEKCYFIQVVCVRKQMTVIKEAVQIDFTYEMPQLLFLVFDGKFSKLGLNFLDGDEALNFRKVLDKHLEERRKKRDDKIKEREEMKRMAEFRNAESTPREGNKVGVKHRRNWYGKITSKGEKQRIRKSQIGGPTGKVYHYGSSTFDQELTAILTNIGVTDDQLRDEATQKIIFKFIAKNGGADAWKAGFGQGRTGGRGPEKADSAGRPSRPPPSPKPGRPNHPQPPPRPGHTGRANAPGTPGPPPPPPPPPPPGLPPPTQSLPLTSSSNSNPVGNNVNLADDLERGKGKLRPVREVEKPKTPERMASGLLDIIRRRPDIDPSDSDSDEEEREEYDSDWE